MLDYFSYLNINCCLLLSVNQIRVRSNIELEMGHSKLKKKHLDFYNYALILYQRIKKS